MREAPSFPRLCAAFVAICCLMLTAEPPAHAGKGKGNIVRSAGHHVKGGHGFSSRNYRHFRRGHFNQRSFHKRGKRSGLLTRRDRKRHHRKRRHYYSSGYYYGYGRSYRYRDYPRYESSYRSEARAAVQPYQTRPVTPKWVHVGSSDDILGSYTAEAPNAEGGLRRNCLSVKTEITVDGKPMEAFDEACLLADGTWELKPSKQYE